MVLANTRLKRSFIRSFVQVNNINYNGEIEYYSTTQTRDVVYLQYVLARGGFVESSWRVYVTTVSIQ
jgi:hypothetical protein